MMQMGASGCPGFRRTAGTVWSCVFIVARTTEALSCQHIIVHFAFGSKILFYQKKEQEELPEEEQILPLFAASQIWFIGVFLQVSPNKASECLWISLIPLIETRAIWVEMGGFRQLLLLFHVGFLIFPIPQLPRSAVGPCTGVWRWKRSMKNTKKKKKSQNTAVIITTTCSSAVKCLEGIDQRSSADPRSKHYLKKVRKQGVN